MNEAVRLRAAVDSTNLVSAVLVPVGPSGQLVQAWLRGDFTLLTSDPLIAEVNAVLARDKILRRPGIDRAAITNIRLALRIRAERVLPLVASELPIRCRDPKDDMVLACALAGRADYIATGPIQLHLSHSRSLRDGRFGNGERSAATAGDKCRATQASRLVCCVHLQSMH